MFFSRTNRLRRGAGAALAVLTALTALAALTTACDDGGSGYTPPTYDTAAARVDYGSANRAVFFDFSTGAITEVPHDFFDIAIDSDSNIIANSGSYGSGVTVYKTASPGADIANDFSADEDKIVEYTFRDNQPSLALFQPGNSTVYQAEANPLGSLPAPYPPGTVSNVFLVRVRYGTETAEYFKVVFSMTMGQTQSFNVRAVPGLGSGTTGEEYIEAPVVGVTDGYGWLYFKLTGDTPRVLNNGTTWNGDGTAPPKAGDWDLLFTRANIELLEDPDDTGHVTLAMGGAATARSAVLLNHYKGVEAAAAAGRSIDTVFNTSGLTFSDEVDAIGYGWYTMVGMGSYTVNTTTYVIRTAEGNYAKFQPGSFYGPGGESYYMTFRYLYSGAASGQFSK
ncbi:MAG: hypothetical protein LBQ55_03975 [Treponema sp.]|jgi:hypothetical protein|nr:hypothetical protein [Treponema sp.]